MASSRAMVLRVSMLETLLRVVDHQSALAWTACQLAYVSCAVSAMMKIGEKMINENDDMRIWSQQIANRNCHWKVQIDKRGARWPLSLFELDSKNRWCRMMLLKHVLRMSTAISHYLGSGFALEHSVGNEGMGMFRCGDDALLSITWIMFYTVDVWIWFYGMGKNSEVKNRTGRVMCGANMVHVIAKPQLRYRESTNLRILKMARTVPTLTTRGDHPLSMDRKKSPNLWIRRNHRNGTNWIKILYRCDGFVDLFGGGTSMRNIMDIGNDMVILIFE